MKDSSWIDEILNDLRDHSWSMGLQGASRDDLDKNKGSSLRQYKEAIEAELVRIIGEDESQKLGRKVSYTPHELMDIIMNATRNDLRKQIRERAGINLKGDKDE